MSHSYFVEQIESALGRALRGTDSEITALVALSGGPDSTALLLAMQAVGQSNHQIKLIAGHVNHGLRGDESDADEKFCRNLSADLGLGFISRKILAPDSSEETLRDMRYAELQKMAQEAGSSICLTGHTRDDQIETFFFRILRGTSPSGLGGIPFTRQLNDGLLLVRPMLELTRQDCLKYLESRNIEARKDSSNNDLNYSRNFLRHEIIPRLSERFPGFQLRVERLIKQIELDDDELLRQADNFLSQTNGEININLLAIQPQSVKSRIIVKLLVDKDIEISTKRIEAILEMTEEPANSEERMSLNSRWDLQSKNGRLQFLDKMTRVQDVQLEQPVSVPGMTLVPKLNLAIKVDVAPNKPVQVFPDKTEWTILADLSSTSGQPILRLRQPGDRISPLGMDCPVRLKKFLHTHKSNNLVKLNNTVVVLADDSEILWIPGLAISRKIAVTGHPTHRISLVELSVDQQSFC